MRICQHVCVYRFLTHWYAPTPHSRMKPASQLRLLGSCGEVEVQAQSAAQDFNKVIYASFAAMAVVYGLVAGLGYYYFGDAASTLVTNDLTNNSPYTGRWVRFRVLAGHGCAQVGPVHYAPPAACVARRLGMVPMSCMT